MPQHQQAVKRVRQNKTHEDRNKAKRSKLRTLYKKALNTTDKEEAQVHHKKAVSYLDKMSGKGIIHPNNAARKKSKLAKHLNSL